MTESLSNIFVALYLFLAWKGGGGQKYYFLFNLFLRRIAIIFYRILGFSFLLLYSFCVCVCVSVYAHACTQMCIRHTCGGWGIIGRCLFPPSTLWVQGIEVMLSGLVVSTFTPGAIVLVSGVFWGKFLRNDTVSYYRSAHFLCFITVCMHVLIMCSAAELQLTLLFLTYLFVVYVFLGICPLHHGYLIVVLWISLVSVIFLRFVWSV